MPHKSLGEMPLLLWLAIALYSLLIVGIIYPLLKFFSLFSPALKDQLKIRSANYPDWDVIKKKRQSATSCVIFYCSSAGEYEQAKPLLDRYAEDSSCFQHIFFFSASGFRYAKKRNETISYSFAPLDTLWAWQKVLSILKPTISIVIRHELWPGFLSVAKTYGRVYVIDAGRWGEDRVSHFKVLTKRLLFKLVDAVFTISKTDREFYQKHLKSNSVYAIGDTKYDRAVERANQKKQELVALRSLFTPYLLTDKNLLIGGSVWKEDVKILLQSLVKVRNQHPAAKNWQMILAPHDLSSEMIAWIERESQNLGLTHLKYSKMQITRQKDSSDPGLKPDLFVIDTLGILTELYGLGSLAFVGGALHHKVHNVLEPVAHGLPVAFGPNYLNSQEAILLIERGIATSVQDTDQLQRWWIGRLEQANTLPHAQIQSMMQDLCGASDLFLRLSQHG